MALDHSNCGICGFQGVDVRLQECGCLVHARCIPVTSIVKEKALTKHEKHAVAPGECLCPSCQMSPVTSIQVLPLNIDELDKAVQLRKKLSREMAFKSSCEDDNDRELAEAQAEASYLLLSHGNSTAALCTDNEYQRTGRWTDDEMTFTNFLVEAFDDGKLPIESGLKLNEFLSNVLLCKSSRLTKKMKNARLSTRSYDFRYPVPPLDVEMLSSLERKFLQSISSEPSRMEVHFNFAKHWRSQLSNLCLQIGSTLLDNSAWIASLEEIERRAIEAEENIRRARRKRVGLSYRRDSQGGQTFESDSAFSGGNKKLKIETRPDFADMEVSSSNESTKTQGPPAEVSSSNESTKAQGPPEVISSTQSNDCDYASSQDFGKIFDCLANDPGVPALLPKRARTHCGPFLEEIIGYVESLKIPFQHVDVWVPSYTTGPSGEEVMRLFHAGYVTSSSADTETFSRLTGFGEFSKTFSFSADEDLPGRVFGNSKPRWVRKLDEADPKMYGRAEGACLYGIKTAFGFPLETSVVDRIIVCMYSTVEVPENPFVVNKCQNDLGKLCPEPQWKLVVEMGQGATSVAPSKTIPSSANNVLASGDTSSVASSYTQGSAIDEDALLDHRLASLLGEYMPNVDGSSEDTTSLVSSLFVPHFMSLRLLLLNPAKRRTIDENNMIDLLRKSFNQYSADKARTNQDLAFLVVKDWQYLQSSYKHTARSSSGAEPARGSQESFASRSSLVSMSPDLKPKQVAEIESDDFNPFGSS